MSYKHRSFSRILLNVDIYCYLNQVVWILEQAENLCWRPLVQADGAAGAAAGGAVVGHPRCQAVAAHHGPARRKQQVGRAAAGRRHALVAVQPRHG